MLVWFFLFVVACGWLSFSCTRVCFCLLFDYSVSYICCLLVVGGCCCGLLLFVVSGFACCCLFVSYVCY